MIAFLSVIDHGITINWELGPTLHKVLAQVRYRNSQDEKAPVLTMRVGASQRCAEMPSDVEDVYCFAASNGDVAAQWIWQALDTGWMAQLNVRNISDEAVWLESIDIVRIDAQTGLFNLGAPVPHWHTATESGALRAWSDQSDRGEPMVVAFKAIPVDAMPPTRMLDASGDDGDGDGDDGDGDGDGDGDDVDTNTNIDTNDDRKIEVAPTTVSPIAMLNEDSVAIHLDVTDDRFNLIAATVSLNHLDMPPNSRITTQGVLIWAEPLAKAA